MSEALLEGLRVVDLAGEAGQLAARMLADLGADVVKVEPPGGDELRREPPDGPDDSVRFTVWNLGKSSVVAEDPDPDPDPRLAALLAAADVVVESPTDGAGAGGGVRADHALAPQAVWVRLSPYGQAGPRSAWRGSDLTAVAGSGNMFATGDPDRAPLHPSEPVGYAHVGAEAVVAALTALASGAAQVADVSVQETTQSANMAGAAQYPAKGFRGKRSGAQIGATQETWSCKDGWIIYGMRGGPARARNWEILGELLEAEGIDNSAFSGRDWRQWNHVNASKEELDALALPLAEFFRRKTMKELYEIGTSRNLMVAPAVSPREVYDNEQVAARGFLAPVGDYERMPQSFLRNRSADGEAARVAPRGPAPVLGESPWPSWEPRPRPFAREGAPERAWEGLKLLEFGSGAAGPLITRYFIEHGATVIRIESRKAPDFLRIYTLDPDLPPLEASSMFAVLNAGKRSLSLNMKDPRAKGLVLELVDWADAVVENFAPKTMAGWGLAYDDLAARKPELVMLSSCLWGNVGPHKDYPGFGSQGAALSGYTFLTGWPDRAPVGPAGTVTDSLAPRYAAAGLAAGLLYQRRTGRGVYLDVSQVEAALFSLSPWLLRYHCDGEVIERTGNRSTRGACPHGAFPCADDEESDDRWIALAVRTDAEWERLAELMGNKDASLATAAARRQREDEVEKLVADWTRAHDPVELAVRLQAAGIDAYPVNDYGDLHSDPQLAAREHFVTLEHPVLGEHVYERSGFRLSHTPGCVPAPGPTLGQHTREILTTVLGRTDAEADALEADGALA